MKPFDDLLARAQRTPRHVALAEGDDPRVIDDFNARVLPFERVRGVHRVEEIPRSPLGKLLRRELERRLR